MRHPKVILYASVVLVLFLLSQKGRTQTKEDSVIAVLGFTKRVIVVKRDTVRLLILEDSIRLRKRKPVLIFCQGSGAVPLLIHDGAELFPPLPFTSWDSSYHILIISKPGIPIFPDSVTASHQFLVNGQPPKNFLQQDKLDDYVRQVNAVISWLRRQSFADPSGLVVFGHSQGARVAARVAAINPYITRAVIASANPYSRFHGFVYELRLKSLADTAHAENYQRQIDSVYLDYRHILNAPVSGMTAPGNKDLYDGSTPESWRSFTEPPMIDDLLKINVPVLLLFGTADPGSADMDRVPFDFMRRGKTNWTLHPYAGLEHNFFGVNAKGHPDYQQFHWNEVSADVFSWLNHPQRSLPETHQ